MSWRRRFVVDDDVPDARHPFDERPRGPSLRQLAQGWQAPAFEDEVTAPMVPGCVTNAVLRRSDPDHRAVTQPVLAAEDVEFPAALPPPGQPLRDSDLEVIGDDYALAPTVVWAPPPADDPGPGDGVHDR